MEPTPRTAAAQTSQVLEDFHIRSFTVKLYFAHVHSSDPSRMRRTYIHANTSFSLYWSSPTSESISDVYRG